MDMYNFNQVSKKTLERNVRLEAQQNAMIQENLENAKADTAAKEASLNEAALSGARFGYASSIKRSQDRVKALQEEIRYTNDASLIAMTEMLSQVVEKGLLLDEEEYSVINPQYKKEIRETVKGLLENGDINTTANPDTLTIMEYISSSLPGVKDGKYLTEDEISAIFKKDKPIEVERAIDSLSGNVSSQVATLVEKEQKRVEKVQKDLEKVTPAQPEEEEQPIPEEQPEEIPQEEEIPEEEQPEEGNPETGEEQFVDGEEGQNPEIAQQPQQQGGRQIHIAPDGTTSISMPNGGLSLNQDGSMDITLAEGFVHETPRSGIIESLAVNAAMNMLESGEKYDADKAIADAILHVTITEALGASGLMTVNEQTYANIIVNAGGSLNEGKKCNKPCVSSKPKELHATASTKGTKKAEIKPTTQSQLQESMAYQWKPIMQHSSPDDLAERIRRKRMLKESTNLNE